MRINELLKAGVDFAFETTLAGSGHLDDSQYRPNQQQYPKN
jgi:hypothetical protein